MGIQEAMKMQQARDQAAAEAHVRGIAITAAATRLAGNDWARQRVGLAAELDAVAQETARLADYFVRYINTGHTRVENT